MAQYIIKGRHMAGGPREETMSEIGKKYPCPCCGYETLPEKPPGTFNICAICFWEDDGYQFDNPDFEGGANHPSLRQAQKNFLDFGAIESRLIEYVRKPTEKDVRDPHWEPLPAMNANPQYKLDVEKWVWTDTDFEQMGWHDVRIHAMSTNETLMDGLHVGLGELLLDIDYILKWPNLKSPTQPEGNLFWVSPATLAFQDVWDLNIKIHNFGGNDPTWDIWSIGREPHDKLVMNKPKAWSWKIELHGGMIDFFATGFEQYIRKKPTL